jgi:anti-sigma factor RsiW
MKRIPQSVEEKLLEYLDGHLSKEASAELEIMIQEDGDVKKRFEELSAADRVLRATSLDQPSLHFTQKVMIRLREQPESSRPAIRKNIYLFLGIVIIILVATLLVSAGVFDGTSSINLDNMVVENSYFKQPLPSIQFDGKTVVNVIIILNIIIAFIVLDRTILRPWFENRRQHY